ncbi:macrophage mannose receptor 1-like [Plakobranchus ocellatus]|uniref:Macrophage mannose receptor 1-like n=1 Tax=Plakobranchus ocellatus TaxID=259542 RepID=A0AAV4ACM8_9GAST|nr:macrophage mannose receptor 1-like [Plakobranchus ocellatus]
MNNVEVSGNQLFPSSRQAIKKKASILANKNLIYLETRLKKNYLRKQQRSVEILSKRLAKATAATFDNHNFIVTSVLSKMFIRKIGIPVTLALVTLMATMYRTQATDQDIHQKLDEMDKHLDHMSSTMLKIQRRIYSQILPDDCFHISDEFKGKRYFMTKTNKSFNISDADAVCQFYGGYIVEFEDADEIEFVFDFVTKVDQGGLHYTGVILRETDQTHVYYHSGKTVQTELWGQGEPNNVGGNEDCAVLTEAQNARGHRLNDVDCGVLGKIVCESE